MKGQKSLFLMDSGNCLYSLWLKKNFISFAKTNSLIFSGIFYGKDSTTSVSFMKKFPNLDLQGSFL